MKQIALTAEARVSGCWFRVSGGLGWVPKSRPAPASYRGSVYEPLNSRIVGLTGQSLPVLRVCGVYVLL